MVSLLARLFIKDSKKFSDPSVHQKYGVLCSFLGVFLNVLLFAGKFFAGLLSGSIAITADAFNNLSDGFTNIITLIGFKLASQKPDREHPFGHGRLEYVCAIIVSVIIFFLGIELFKSSISKIANPKPVTFSMLMAILLVISVIIKLYMAFYNKSIGEKINSSVMKATAADSLSDSIATFSVLVSMIISHLFNINIDPFTGILVSIFIVFTGVKTLKETVDPLLGKTPSREFISQIEDIVIKYKAVVGIHNLVVYDYGSGRIMISLHAEVNGDKNIYELHNVIENIENELQQKLNCEAVIHMDPVATDDTLTVELKEKVAQKVKSIDPIISIHDFRVVEGDTHTNLIFDAVIPPGFYLSPGEISKKIIDLVKEIDENYFAVVKIEKSYI